MSTAEQTAAAGAAPAAEAVLLDEIVTRTKPADETERERNKSYIDEFLKNVVKPGQVVSKDVETNLKYWIGELDKKTVRTTQRDHARPGVPEAGRDLARAALPGPQ